MINRLVNILSHNSSKGASRYCSGLPDRDRSFKLFFIRLFSFAIVIVFLFSCASEDVKQEPLKPEEGLAKADKLIDDMEYEEARRVLNEIKGNDTTRKYAPIAQLKIAESYVKEENLEMAVSEYRRFTDHYPDSQYAAYSQYQIAMIYFDQIKGPDRGAGQAKSALAEFLKLKKMYPRNPYKIVVDVNIKKCLNVIGEYEFLVGKFYFKKGSHKAALGRLLGIINDYPDYGEMDKVLYYVALSYRNSEDMDNAMKYFEMLKKKYPESHYVEELTEELSEDE